MIQTVKLTENGYLVNGNMSVPNAPGNRHYQAVQEWIAEGNTPEPVDIKVVDKTTDETEALIRQEMRDIAIKSLQTKGKLDNTSNVIK